MANQSEARKRNMDKPRDQDRDPPLHTAAFAGDLTRIRELLRDTRQRRMLDCKNRLGCTPLRLAATAGHAHCVGHLLREGAEVNMADIKAQTPLLVAVKNKHIECVRVLLWHGADPEGSLLCLYSPLYFAAFTGNLPALRELVWYGANLNSVGRSMCDKTPLHIAIAYHHFPCFKFLLLAGADPNHTIFGSSAQNVDTSSVQSTFPTSSNVNQTQNLSPNQHAPPSSQTIHPPEAVSQPIQSALVLQNQSPPFSNANHILMPQHVLPANQNVAPHISETQNKASPSSGAHDLFSQDNDVPNESSYNQNAHSHSNFQPNPNSSTNSPVVQSSPSSGQIPPISNLNIAPCELAHQNQAQSFRLSQPIREPPQYAFASTTSQNQAPPPPLPPPIRNQQQNEYSVAPLYHYTIRHNVEADYVSLLWECGADIYSQDGRGQLAGDIDSRNECAQCIRSLYGEPRPLLKQCRSLIRLHIARDLHRMKSRSWLKRSTSPFDSPLFQCLNRLPLPKSSIRFLQCHELTGDA